MMRAREGPRMVGGADPLGGDMAQADIDEMGPIDYIVLEWPSGQPTGEAFPRIIYLVDRGIIRILDVAFMAKDEIGAAASVDLGALNGDGTALAEFEGASSGL